MLTQATGQPSSERRHAPVYQVYGLRLSSHVPLACPQETRPGHADMELVATSNSLRSPLVRQRLRRPEADDWFHHAALDDGSTYLLWTRLSEFLISPDGRLITCHALDEVSSETLSTYLITQALSCAMVQQGIEPLHATVAVVDGEAVAFLGNCGHGKSSLGAAFLKAGYPLLTDDLLVLSQDESPSGRLAAQPGPARIKLFPEIAKSLIDTRRTGVRMNPETSKLILPLSQDEHCATAVPLRTIYVLNQPAVRRPARRISIRTLSPRRACLELIANTFNLIITDRSRLKRQFEWAARLATLAPVKSLSYPRNLSQIGNVVDAICEDRSR